MYIENGFLVLDKDDIQRMKIKKMSGHSFVALAGLDKYKTAGDALLELHGFIKPDVDPKWLKRGDLAEKIVLKVYSRNHNCVTYDKKEIKYDNFQDKVSCGGLIDIEIPDEKTLIEVKSKSMKDYEKICENQPLSEVYQGLYYGFLRGYKEITMEWIFFDKETEEQVFKNGTYTTLKNIKRYSKKFDVVDDDIKDKIRGALKKIHEFRQTHKIPLSEISQSVLSVLVNPLEAF